MWDKRDDMIVYEEDPFNAESPRAALSTVVTATDGFYSRNHGPIPQLDTATYRLRVDGLVGIFPAGGEGQGAEASRVDASAVIYPGESAAREGRGPWRCRPGTRLPPSAGQSARRRARPRRHRAGRRR